MLGVRPPNEARAEGRTARASSTRPAEPEFRRHRGGVQRVAAEGEKTMVGQDRGRDGAKASLVYGKMRWPVRPTRASITSHRPAALYSPSTRPRKGARRER